MFQWADGGSLREFYEKLESPKIEASLIKDIIQQLVGLADALCALHNYGGKGSYRHGDLKPENILIFGDNTIRVGIWKIADLGLAKHHATATGLRGPTSTRYGTRRYEPPDVLDTQSARSRLYDIWSMGCIILELIIWLLYGYKTLVDFNKSMRDHVRQDSPYWDMVHGTKPAIVHSNVEAIIGHMKKDPECRGSTAIGDLLHLVETRLLKVALPEGNNLSPKNTSNSLEEAEVNIGPELGISVHIESPAGNSEVHTSPPGTMLEEYRATAEEFHDILLDIQLKGENETYLFTGISRNSIARPPLQNQALKPQSVSANISPGNRPSTSPKLETKSLLQTPSGVSIFHFTIPCVCAV